MRPADADARVIREEPGRAPFDSCPNCDGGTFDTEATADRPVFRCVQCGAGWLYELGYVRPAGSTGHPRPARSQAPPVLAGRGSMPTS